MQVLGKHLPEEKVVRVQYTDKNNFRVQAKQLGIMEDLKVRNCYIEISEEKKLLSKF